MSINFTAENGIRFVPLKFNRNIFLILSQKVIDRWKEVVRFVYNETFIEEIVFRKETKLYNSLSIESGGQ
jgi:hypothetical protein